MHITRGRMVRTPGASAYIMPVGKSFDGTPTVYVGGLRYFFGGIWRSITGVYGSTHSETLDRLFRVYQIRHQPFEELVSNIPHTKRLVVKHGSSTGSEAAQAAIQEDWLNGVPLSWHPAACTCPHHTL